MSRREHLVRLTRQAVTAGGWALTGALVAVLAVAVLVPRLGGGTPYAVLTGSMSPGMPAGSLVVVRPTHTVRIGDVVTYQLRSGEPVVVTHRVVAVGRDQSGREILRTQGDANKVLDAAWVRPEQVRGTRWYAVPLLGHVTVALDGLHTRALDVVVAVVLLSYAAWLVVVTAVRRAGRTRRSTRTREVARVHP